MKLKLISKYSASISLAALLAMMAGCNSQSKSADAVKADKHSPLATVKVSNPLDTHRELEPLYFSFYDLGIDNQVSRNLAVKLKGNTIPSQIIDRDGDNESDGIFVLLNFAPAETQELEIVSDPQANAESRKLTQAEISRKTGGKWQPRKENPALQEYVGGKFENVRQLTPPPQHTDHSWFIRYEGPGIESDKVGYRVYLDERNGFDIFGKKTNDVILQKVGQDGFDSYHEMADWGMDILKVGKSLGAGGYGYWNGDSVELVSEVDGWDAKIVENGDLYSALQIVYKNWQVAGKSIDLTANLSMHGGSRLVHTRLDLSEPLPNLAIGLVKHPGTELIKGDMNITGEAYTYIASWGKQSLNDDNLGMALLFRQNDLKHLATDASNYVAVIRAAASRADYYFLAAWEQELNGIKTREEFVNYLQSEAERLTLAPRVHLHTAYSQANKSLPASADEALGWAKKLADSELQRKTLGYRYDGWDVNRERKPKFEYDIVGLLPLAYDELAEETKDPKHAQVIKTVTGSFITDSGEILNYNESSYNIDSVAPGRSVLRLYDATGAEKYKIAASQLRRQLKNHPRTSEGAFWHKKKYDSQLWLDGVYMGMPFLARYARLFENGDQSDATIEEVVKEFKITRKYLRDPETGLYYHAWDEKKQQKWAGSDTGLSRYFWARGLGWLSMALVDVLDFIPEDDKQHRQPLIDMIQELAPVLVKYQDPATGTWWQILDQPNATGNYLESSASSMFTYFFAKAVNKGYLPQSYKDVAQKAFDGLVNEFITVHRDGNVSLTNICLVAGLGYGRDGSYRYYMSEPVVENDPKGTGPFILAGVQVHRMLNR